MSAVVDLIKATIEALSRLAPKSKLAESLTALDPNVPSERALMKELMDLAFDVNTGSVDRLDFIEDMVFFIKSAGACAKRQGSCGPWSCPAWTWRVADALTAYAR